MTETKDERRIPEDILFGNSPALEELRQTSMKVSGTTVPIMITGETGTGKEVLAEYIQARSPWREGPFARMNCPVLHGTPANGDPLQQAIFSLLPPSAAELTSKPALAHGTLLLNEIALLNSSLQVRLLERLGDGPVLRLELPEDGRLDLQIICTTNRRLEQEIEAGNFLRKLYHKLDVIELELPPLRNRAEDIPRLVDYFLAKYNRQFHSSTPLPSQPILNRLNEYRWPGNIRELENLMMRYVLKGTEEAFAGELGARPHRTAPAVLSHREPLPLKRAAQLVVQEFERKIIRKVLEEHHWNRRETARALKISYRALLYKIKEAGVPPKRNAPRAWSGLQASAAYTAPPKPGGPSA